MKEHADLILAVAAEMKANLHKVRDIKKVVDRVYIKHNVIVTASDLYDLTLQDQEITVPQESPVLIESDCIHPDEDEWARDSMVQGHVRNALWEMTEGK